METQSPTDKNTKNPKRITITLSWKLLSVVLAILLVGLTVYTRPWEQNVSDRTLNVTGEAVVKREPDLFIFYPSYEKESQAEVVAWTNELVAKVKELGLGDAGIQTNVSNYDTYDNFGMPTGTKTYSAYLTLSVDNKEVAQKIQDYLVSIEHNGSSTPSYDFTRETKNELKDEAVILAIEDARQRAERQATNLNVTLGKVVNVNEPQDFEVYPMGGYSMLDSVVAEGLPINAGESEFTYKVEVEFEIR